MADHTQANMYVGHSESNCMCVVHVHLPVAQEPSAVSEFFLTKTTSNMSDGLVYDLNDESLMDHVVQKDKVVIAEFPEDRSAKRKAHAMWYDDKHHETEPVLKVLQEFLLVRGCSHTCT